MLNTTKIAIEAATRAGKLLDRLVHTPHSERVKEKGVAPDIVTESDIASNDLITSIIRKAFPTHAILSEETSEVTNPKEHSDLWIVDPIDGTISFAAGIPVYTVSIAYCKNGKLVSSALFMPDTHEVLWAETGSGAWSGKTRLHVRNLPWEKCVVGFDQSIRKRKVAMTQLAPKLAIEVRFLHMTAGLAHMLGLVAKGSLQATVVVYPSSWDYAAGILLVREAGGVVKDFLGRDYPMFSESGLIATAPSALPHILKHTKKVAKYFLEP